MSRGLTTSQLNLVTASHRIVVVLIELFYDSGTLRLAVNQWDIVSGANTYIGVGPIIDIGKIIESSTSIEGLTLRMSGLDPAIITLATTEPYVGRLARLLKAYVDPTSNAVVGAPRVIVPLRMRSQNIVEQNNSATVTLTLEHYDAELDRVAPLRWSNTDQQRLYPGDRGCEYAANMTERNIIWPSKEALKHP